METLSSNPDEFCRLCLKPKPYYLQLFNEQIIEMLESLTSIKISYDDPGPHLTCFGCYVATKVAYTTQQRLIKSEMFLREKTVIEIVIKDEAEEIDISEMQILEHAIKSEVNETPQPQPQPRPRPQPKKRQPIKRAFKPRIKKQISFQCETCSRTYNNYYAYTAHVKIHATRQCLMCLNDIPVREFKQHIKTHDSGQCTYCESKLKHSASLRKHMMLCHREPKIMCDQCGEILDSKRMFEIHNSTHHPKHDPFICDYCAAKFYRLELLKKHIKQKHAVEKPFSCTVCNKSFSMKCKLTVHELIHSNKKSFICEICGKGFKSRTYLNIHKKGVHGWKLAKFKCELCGVGFASKFALSTHVLRKHNE